MSDRVGQLLEHLDRPVHPRREFEDALLRSCLASLAGGHPLPAGDTAALAVAVTDGGGPGSAPTAAGGARSSGGYRSTGVRLRSLMIGIGTAALLGGLLGASLVIRERGQVGLQPPGSTSRTATAEPVARYLDVLRADYPTIADDVQRFGIRCVNMPSPDLPQCRTYVLDLRTAARSMRDDLGASSVPPTLVAYDAAIRRDLGDLMAGADVQLWNIAAGNIRCCPVDDANALLHGDVFAALGVASLGRAPTG